MHIARIITVWLPFLSMFLASGASAQGASVQPQNIAQPGMTNSASGVPANSPGTVAAQMNGNSQKSDTTRSSTANAPSGVPANSQGPAAAPVNANPQKTDSPQPQNVAAGQNGANQTNTTAMRPIAAPRQKDNAASCASQKRIGIGFQSGIRFHEPDKFNDFVTDLWNLAQEGFTGVSANSKVIGPGVFAGLNGAVDLCSWFQVASYAQEMWAGKEFYFCEGIDKNLFINTYTTIGGLNLWVRLFNIGKAAIRFGTGGYAAYTIAKVSGDFQNIRLWGTGFGGRTLAGATLPLGKAVVTLDAGVSYGYTELVHKTGDIGKSPLLVRSPKRLDHLGIELFPGILFYF